jgi:uncharacterized membrane protein (DUF485 family)
LEKFKDSSKKDYWHIVTVLAMLIVVLIIQLSFNDGMFTAKLEMASTLISIVLAVIAIVITLTEGTKNARANDEILSSSEAIKNSTQELTGISNELKNIYNLTTEIQHIKSAVISMQETAVTKSDIEDMLNSAKTSLQLNQENEIVLDALKFDKVEVCKIVILNLKGEYGLISKLILGIAYINQEQQLNIHVAEIASSIAEMFKREEGKINNSNYFVGITIGMLGLLKALQVVTYINNEQEKKYYYTIDNDIIGLIKERLGTDTDLKEKLDILIKSIKK